MINLSLPPRKRVTVLFALVGGIVFDRFGAGVLFAFAAGMALANSAFALTIPKPPHASP